jgi:predicted Rossmann-fold nucleotide-binding protein
LCLTGAWALGCEQGGAGTFDELWESVAAVGLGFINIPIICVNADGFYDPFHAMLLKGESSMTRNGPLSNAYAPWFDMSGPHL